MEKIVPFTRPPSHNPPWKTVIHDSKDETVNWLKESKAKWTVFSDGSAKEEGVGAAAVLYKDGVTSEARTLRFKLGPIRRHGIYEAEIIGTILAVHLLSKEKVKRGDEVVILADNQSAISASRRIHKRSGQHLSEAFHSDALNLNFIKTKHLGRPIGNLTIAWIAGHSGVGGNERADAEANKAAEGKTSPLHKLPPSLTDILLEPKKKEIQHSLSMVNAHYKKKMKTEWNERWQKSERLSYYKKMGNGRAPFANFYKLAGTMSKAQASLLIQLRSGHTSLNAHLHRIKKAASPLCDHCGRDDPTRQRRETVKHYLFDCGAWTKERYELLITLGPRQSHSFAEITNAKNIAHLFKFVKKTRRFEQSLGDVTKSPNDETDDTL